MKIGILGGIGPEATGRFYLNLIGMLQNSDSIKSNSDFPQIIINSLPAKEMLEFNYEDFDISEYVDGLALLDFHDVDFIVIVCDSLYLYLDQLQSNVEAPILHLPNLVKHKVSKLSTTICVLGSKLTTERNLYGVEENKIMKLSYEQEIELENLLISYNSSGLAGNNCLSRFVKLLADIKKQNKDLTFLSASNEVSSLFRYTKGYTYLDTMDILAKSVTEIVLASKNYK